MSKSMRGICVWEYRHYDETDVYPIRTHSVNKSIAIEQLQMILYVQSYRPSHGPLSKWRLHLFRQSHSLQYIPYENESFDAYIFLCTIVTRVCTPNKFKRESVKINTMGTNLKLWLMIFILTLYTTISKTMVPITVCTNNDKKYRARAIFFPETS